MTREQIRNRIDEYALWERARETVAERECGRGESATLDEYESEYEKEVERIEEEEEMRISELKENVNLKNAIEFAKESDSERTDYSFQEALLSRLFKQQEAIDILFKVVLEEVEIFGEQKYKERLEEFCLEEDEYFEEFIAEKAKKA